ncbi:hypothetical protein CLU79DRAFT_782355 [Phycomyces nitens]|nr:hypothetical protein CLU79DRAFT_782355 [Phycomyces nitens]
MPGLFKQAKILCGNFKPRMFPPVWILLFMFAVNSTAAPLGLDELVSPTKMAIISVIKTIVLAYASHAATIRPETSRAPGPSIAKRMLAIAWPVSGVHEAIGSMIKAYRGNKILNTPTSLDRKIVKDKKALKDWRNQIKIKVFDMQRLSLLVEKRELEKTLVSTRGRIRALREEISGFLGFHCREVSRSEYNKCTSDLEYLLDEESGILFYKSLSLRSERAIFSEYAKFQADIYHYSYESRINKFKNFAKETEDFNLLKEKLVVYDADILMIGEPSREGTKLLMDYKTQFVPLANQTVHEESKSMSDNIEENPISEKVVPNDEYSILSNKGVLFDHDGQDDSSDELANLVKKYKVLDESKIDWTYKFNNSAYLSAVFKSMDSSIATSTKAFITNGNMYMGIHDFSIGLFDQDSYVWGYQKAYQRTDEMNISGPGADYNYQVPIHPALLRYLPPDMLDQLEDSVALGEPEIMSKIFTLVQLGYSVYEIVEGTGDNWSKLIMGVFMIMSLLQTISLMILPAQSVSYSIKGNPIHGSLHKFNPMEDPQMHQYKFKELDLEFYEGIHTSHKHYISYAMRVLALTGMPLKDIEDIMEIAYTENVSFSLQSSGKWEYAVVFGGIAVPLLLGLVAGYGEKSTTEWIVISWIVGSLPFIIFRINFLERYSSLSLINLAILILVTALPGVALVLSATIIGYMPKDQS